MVKSLLLFMVVIGSMSSVVANAAPVIAGGRAACGSDSNKIYSVQFGWDAKGKITDVSLTKSDEPNSHSDYDVVNFDLKKDNAEFTRTADGAVLKVADEKGNRVILEVSVDANRIGKGVISWSIKGDNFVQNYQTATCSF